MEHYNTAPYIQAEKGKKNFVINGSISIRKHTGLLIVIKLEGHKQIGFQSTSTLLTIPHLHRREHNTSNLNEASAEVNQLFQISHGAVYYIQTS